MACTTCAQKALRKVRALMDQHPPDDKLEAIVRELFPDMDHGEAMALPVPTGDDYRSPLVPTADLDVTDLPPAIEMVIPSRGFPRPRKPSDVVTYDDSGRAHVATL